MTLESLGPCSEELQIVRTAQAQGVKAKLTFQEAGLNQGCEPCGS